MDDNYCVDNITGIKGFTKYDGTRLIEVKEIQEVGFENSFGYVEEEEIIRSRQASYDGDQLDTSVFTKEYIDPAWGYSQATIVEAEYFYSDPSAAFNDYDQITFTHTTTDSNGYYYEATVTLNF